MLLDDLVHAAPQGRPVYWDEVITALIEHLKAAVATGLLDRASAEKYLELAQRWVRYCENQPAPVLTVQGAEGLGVALAAGWVKAPGRDPRTNAPVMPGPGAQRLRRTAGRLLWGLLFTLGVSQTDLFLRVEVPPASPGARARPLDDFEALALRTLCWGDPLNSRRNAAVAGALLGATQEQLRHLLACDVDLDQGIVRMPGSGKHDARILVLDDFARPMFRKRLEDLAGTVANGTNYLDEPLISGRTPSGDLTTAEVIGNLLCEALTHAAVRGQGVTPKSMALWASLRAFYHGPHATVLASTPGPNPARDLDAAAFVRGVSARAASDALGLLSTDNEDPYGFINP